MRSPLPLPAALLFAASSALGQARIEPVAPRLSPAPTAAIALPSFSTALSAFAPAALASALPSSPSLRNIPAPSAAARRQSAAPWLELAGKKHAAAFNAAIDLARSTRAGRRALDAAKKTLDQEGWTLPVDVLDLGRYYGDYEYVDKRLRLNRKLFRPGREKELASTLAHELLHVAHHAQGIPSNALEMEIEAHLLGLELLDQLGAKPQAKTFARQANDALRKGPKEFIALIERAVPGSPFLDSMSFEEIEDQLEDDREAAEAGHGPRAAKNAQAIAADLDLIGTPKGRRDYRNFSRRVLARLKSRAAAAR